LPRSSRPRVDTDYTYNARTVSPVADINMPELSIAT
jgi:hypothetical protein